MATLKILGSSSSANCYILECDNEILLIELGIKFDEVLKAIDYDLSKLKCCIVTHSHNDHAKYIQNALFYGLSVYSCQDVQSIHSDVKVLQNGLKTQIGAFQVQPIPLQHNVECIGFLIITPDKQKILFATDTNSIPYRFKNIQHYIIEANSDFDLMIDDACNNVFSRSASNNHMDINDTIDFLKENFDASCQSITLIHLSQQNADGESFKKRVQDELGFNNVNIAKKGLIIELNKEEF